ncbi:MAG TPA: VCBS repeat-containing protein, partial [Polyangiaceae bacterium]
MSSPQVLSLSWLLVGSWALAGLSSCGARTAMELASFEPSGGFAGAAGGALSSEGGGRGGVGQSGASPGGVANQPSSEGGSALGGAAGIAGGNVGGAGLGTAGLAGAAGSAGSSGCDASMGMVPSAGGCVPVLAPRLLSPLSTAHITAHQARLTWSPAPGTDAAFVQVCLDRACTHPTESFRIDQVNEALTTALTPGVYFWRVYGVSGNVTSQQPSATWQFSVGHHSDSTQTLPHTSWGTVFDANGDGYADVILGAPDLGNGGNTPPSLGHAYVFMGSAAGLASTAAVTLTGPNDGSAFGNAACSAGDVNGDGYADAIVGAEGASSNRGNAYVYYGGPNGLSNTPATTLYAPDGGSFGHAVASAGDINGDGYADVIVGARYVRVPFATNQYAGHAYLYFGGAMGIDASSPITLTGST